MFNPMGPFWLIKPYLINVTKGSWNRKNGISDRMS
jgi:hypothetical protein